MDVVSTIVRNTALLEAWPKADLKLLMLGCILPLCSAYSSTCLWCDRLSHRIEPSVKCTTVNISTDVKQITTMDPE